MKDLKHLLVFLFAALIAVPATASILPPNKLYRFDRRLADDPVKKKQFEDIIDHVVGLFRPAAAHHGVEIVSHKLWSDPQVNAMADQVGTKWHIYMFGGLFRRPEVTPDSFALVVCHELGHHFAGYVFGGARDPMSSEGQADYFATQVCGPKIFERTFRGNSVFRFDPRTGTSVPPIVQAKCDTSWRDVASQERCYRLAAAGLSLATLLHALEADGNPKPPPLPKFDTPDPMVRTRTYVWHPPAQCRLDTYFHGALCTKGFDPKVIPGKGHRSGHNSLDAEKDAVLSSCTQAEGFTQGYRPRCWFKPLMDGPLHTDDPVLLGAF